MSVQVQRYRIFRQLAMTYAMKSTGKWMMEKLNQLEGGKELGGEWDLGVLREVASMSAGLKAICTFQAWQGIEDCRKCCGGNGYLLTSGIAALAGDYVWQTTAEGDYVILMLQTARYLVKTLQGARKGQPVTGPVDYLAPLKDPNFSVAKAAPPPAKSPEQFYDVAYLISLFRYRALVAVWSAAQQLDEKIRAGTRTDDAWNSVAVELTEAVKAHTSYFMLSQFAAVVKEVADKSLREPLQRLVILFATSNILDEQWYGLIKPRQLRYASTVGHKVMEELRPDAVALVDAFDFPDRTLNSHIGRFDGNVYEAMWNSAVKSPLNQFDPFDGYDEILRPHLDLDLLKHGNRPISTSNL